MVQRELVGVVVGRCKSVSVCGSVDVTGTTVVPSLVSSICAGCYGRLLLLALDEASVGRDCGPWRPARWRLCAYLVAVPAAGFVVFFCADHDHRVVVGGRLAVYHALGAAGGAPHITQMACNLSTISASAMRRGHGAERLAPEIEVEARR